MKKVIMSLGFAAATILAAQAQEVTPQEEQQTETQEYSQEEINPQEEQMQEYPQDEQTEQYPEDQTIPQEETFPEEEQYPQEEEQYPEEEAIPQEETLPEEQATPQEEPLPEEEQQSPEFQEEGINPQDEQTEQYPEEQTTPQEQPTEQNPQEQATPQEQETSEDPEFNKEEETLKEHTKEHKKNMEFPDEDLRQVNKSEIPSEVKDALENSDYQGATINQAFVLSGTALRQALEEVETSSIYGDEEPKTLYQLQVSTEDNKSAVVYITEKGEVYATKDME